MPLDPTIFKAYDIRGLSPEQLDADSAYLIGQAIVKFTGAKVLAVGKDMRATTPEIFAALARGIMSQGSDVVDIGLVTTPMVYFAACEYAEHEAGVMVTASHNPSEYNGIKICLGDALPIGGSNGLMDIRDLALAGPYEPVSEPGELHSLDIREAYLKKLFSYVDLNKINIQDLENFNINEYHIYLKGICNKCLTNQIN